MRCKCLGEAHSCSLLLDSGKHTAVEGLCFRAHHECGLEELEDARKKVLAGEGSEQREHLPCPDLAAVDLTRGEVHWMGRGNGG